MFEIGGPTLIGLGPGIIAILVVLGTFAAAGMYAFGRRSGWDAGHHQVYSQLLPMLSDTDIANLNSTVMSKNLRRALDNEIIRRDRT